jgi:CheY-like chemotaxis protein
MSAATSAPAAASVLIVDADIVARHAIADYLRRCGYAVVEAANTGEALVALTEPSLSIDIIVCDIAAIGTKPGFELANWVREHRPELEVRLAGTLEGAVSTAANLCESGPHLAKPYEPEAVIDYINRLRATASCK